MAFRKQPGGLFLSSLLFFWSPSYQFACYLDLVRSRSLFWSILNKYTYLNVWIARLKFVVPRHLWSLWMSIIESLSLYTKSFRSQDFWGVSCLYCEWLLPLLVISYLLGVFLSLCQSESNATSTEMVVEYKQVTAELHFRRGRRWIMSQLLLRIFDMISNQCTESEWMLFSVFSISFTGT